MPNPYRGEVECLIGGTTATLRLTLGALAEIEDAFAVTSLTALGERLAGGGLRAGDIITLLTAALRGAGSMLERHEVGAKVEACELPGAVAALGRLFAAAFGPAEEPSPDPRAARR